MIILMIILSRSKMNVMDKLIVFNGCVGVNNVIFGLFKNLFRGFEL